MNIKRPQPNTLRLPLPDRSSLFSLRTEATWFEICGVPCVPPHRSLGPSLGPEPPWTHLPSGWQTAPPALGPPPPSPYAHRWPQLRQRAPGVRGLLLQVAHLDLQSQHFSCLLRLLLHVQHKSNKPQRRHVSTCPLCQGHSGLPGRLPGFHRAFVCEQW